MNIFKKMRSVRTKMIVAGLAMFCVAGMPIFTIVFVLVLSLNNSAQIQDKANEIHVQSHILQVAERDLLLSDSKSESFYKTGESKNIKEVKATEASMEKEAKTLTSKTGGKMKQWSLELQKSLNDFEKDFAELTAQVRKLGYVDYGLEGQLRTAAHNLENVSLQTGNLTLENEVLQLRRYEKDYIMRHDDQSKQLAKAQIQKLRALLGSPASLSSLSQYETAFNDYVATQERIGLTKEVGLRANNLKSLASIEDLSVKIANEANQASQGTRSTLVWVVIVSYILLPILFGTEFYLLGVLFSKPIVEIKDRAVEIGEGKLNAKIDIRSRDEIGVLAEAVDRTREKLRAQVVEISESVNTLSTAASQILTTTNELAAGASETASAMSETSTTVEEVKQTAKLSSEKAKDVAEGAKMTGQVSETGKQSVSEAIERMNDINQQMDSIAESVVGLSEQSQAIGEIIETVNDLAEKSNLLAVNASIEAAKAGEQGKGFTVVAQEVRSLAEQSKEATDQIKAILNDIQKATAAAVMSTERGSKAVETGVVQSVEAGKSIEELAASIRTATQMAVQIEASSREQSAGTDQIATSMESISLASMQTANGLKQLESAAQNLRDVGERLKQLIEQYQT